MIRHPRRHTVKFASLFSTTLLAFGASSPSCSAQTTPVGTPPAIVAKTVDKHSFANPDEARVTHIDLDAKVDFASKRITGVAALSLETAAAAHRVILDTKTLEISSVTDAAGGALEHHLGTGNAMLGQPLEIVLPQGVKKVIVHYRTSTKSEALNWLNPEQTAGKVRPFLFSSGESISTRTWLPTQDSPAIRQTYSARIVVPKALMAVMSAEMLTPGGETVDGDDSVRAFRFNMDKPIAPYLIAVAVGDIGFAPVGERSGVYAEKVTLAKAAYEFADLGKMLQATEKLYGPYRWGRYDVLVLPPSFPFGGMENPRLTYVTPTLLAGDRSLVAVVVHEIAHSWSGNLVGHATWEDFWLNEGFTDYVENRVVEELYGRDRAMMLQMLEYRDLNAQIKEYLSVKNGNLTKLHQNLSGIHPDDAFSSVPYEKGAGLLRQIESVVGRQEMDAWLKGYFERHAFESMTTDAFVEDIQDHLLHHDPLLENKIHLSVWLNGEGLPENFIVPQSDAFDRVDAQVAAFMAGTETTALATAAYSPQEWQHFIIALPDTISLDQMTKLDDTFQFSKNHNAEIQVAWLELCIKHHYALAMPALHDFLVNQGRRKFIVPLYKQLMAQEGWGAEMAKTIYAQTRPGYHALTQTSVDAVIAGK